MENVNEEEQQIEINQSCTIESSSQLIDETNNAQDLSTNTSLIQSLLLKTQNEIEDPRTKKKKQIKTARQKELERLTKVANIIFNSSEQLNIVCERINSLLLGHKTTLYAACCVLDKLHSGRLLYDQFRLIIRDRLPEMSIEDIFVFAKLFEIEGSVDYQAALDENLGDGILKYIKSLPVPQPEEIILEKSISKELKKSFDESLQLNRPRYVTLHLRFLTFDSYNNYPGHIDITIPDHTSIYALSKMIIDKTDLAVGSVSIFCEKTSSRNGLLDPMRSLKDHSYLGAYVDGSHKQPFPTYTLYYDYSPIHTHSDCPILKCDYYMK